MLSKQLTGYRISRICQLVLCSIYLFIYCICSDLLSEGKVKNASHKYICNNTYNKMMINIIYCISKLLKLFICPLLDCLHKPEEKKTPIPVDEVKSNLTFLIEYFDSNRNILCYKTELAMKAILCFNLFENCFVCVCVSCFIFSAWVLLY